MSDWLKELQQEISSRKRNGLRRMSVEAPIETKNHLVLPLFLLLCILLVGLVGVYSYKNGLFRSQDYPIQSESAPRSAPTDVVTLEKIWQRTNWNSEAITLMADINNHNLYVSQANLSRDNYIYLNSDWTINRIPDHIQLDQQSREFLERHIKK
jgi:hypothetical protein